MRVTRTADREPRIATWLEQERVNVVAAFGEAAWPVVAAVIESVPWEPDVDRAMADAAEQIMHPHQLTPEEAARNIAGRRTMASLTRYEHTAALARRLGLRHEEMEALRCRLEAERPERTGRTALYRHRDAAGRLLYVGISATPDLRAEQHRARSDWWRFVADTQTEWFASGEEAAQAERETIETERPIFNQTHNRKARDRAVAYLFDHLRERVGS